MFDDPKKELRRLEDQLLAAEEPQWEPQEEELPEEEPGGLFLRQEEPEEEEEAPAPKPSRVPMLLAALLLEIAALFGVLAWWLLWR